MSETTAIVLGTYHDVDIPVRPSDQYINATAMCRATGKLWGNYWQNQETSEFLNALSLDIGIPISKLVLSVRGNASAIKQGTWVHRRVAIHLAQWCSPEFAVWVTGRIEELMLAGRTSIVREHAETDLAGKLGGDVAAEMLGMQREVIGKLDQVLASQSRIEKHVERVPVIRKEIPEPVKRSCRIVVACSFGGKCPCCLKNLIVNTQTLETLQGACYDHWTSRGSTGHEEVWLVCSDCNIELGEPGSSDRQKRMFMFMAYQQHRSVTYSTIGKSRGHDVVGQLPLFTN